MSLGSPQLDAALDRYLTSCPEDYMTESGLKCSECEEEIYEGEEYYEIDGECLCNGCANEWFYAHKRVAEAEDFR